MDCVFCREDGGDVLWQDDSLRVVLADEHDYPGFCRVIWNEHVAAFLIAEYAFHRRPRIRCTEN